MVEPDGVVSSLASRTGRCSVDGVSHFAAQGKERVYASDHYGNLMILDSKTGSVLGNLPTSEGMTTLVNDESDRIYLVNDRGLVQCLREIGATEPTLYRKPTEVAAPGSKPAAKPGEEASPFEAEAPAAAAPKAESAPAAPKTEAAPAAAAAKPAGAAPKGGRTVVTWAHGTTGIADVCAPSKAPDAATTDRAMAEPAENPAKPIRAGSSFHSAARARTN